MTQDALQKFIFRAPSKPGIYRFRNKRKEDIYIGKASNLKSRLRSYLRNPDPRIRKMIADAASIKYEPTSSDIEALILESLLIKQQRPLFNIMLRDDKQYFYVVFTKDKFPKIFITHQPQSKKIGPFTDGAALKSTLRFLRSIFPYCTCKTTHYNYCLNYHIGKCLGFCCLKPRGVTPERACLPSGRDPVVEYKNNIKAIKDILSGRKNSLIKELRSNMDHLARKGDLDAAIELRKKVEKLERIFENAVVIKRSELIKEYRSGLGPLLKIRKPLIRIEGYDISNIQGIHATGSMVTFIHGQPDKNFYRKFNIRRVGPAFAEASAGKANDMAMLGEIIKRRFNHPEWPFPDLIVIDGGKGQINSARKVLKEMYLTVPVVGISKNQRHMGHFLVIPGRANPLPLAKLSPADRNLLLAIDTEAHRFAVSHYRRLHRSSLK